MHKNEKTQNSHSFLALAFLGAFGHNGHLVIMALFAILKCKCEKN
jgi:hypothetical protein